MLEEWIGDDRPPFYLLEILVDLLNEKIKIKDLKQDDILNMIRNRQSS